MEQVPPSLPPRDTHDESGDIAIDIDNTTPHIIDNNEIHSLSTELFMRQLETYTLPIMNEMSDLFAVKSLSDDLIKQKVDKIIESSNREDEYWKKFVLSDDVAVLKYGRDPNLQHELIKGIPPDFRGLIYMKVFHIKYQLSKEKYTNLLHKSLKTESENDAEIEKLDDTNVKNALKVFDYYTTEVLQANNKMDIINNDDLLTNFYQSNELNIKFIIRVGEHLSKIPNIHEEEILYILLKFNKLLINLNKDQLFYEILRSIEDQVPQVFQHISKEGCNLKEIIRNEIFKNFLGHIKNVSLMHKILDFVLFQGFCFLARLFVYVFTECQDEILVLNADELNRFLVEGKGFKAVSEDSDLENVVEIEPEIIKYENEYYLIHVNSLNNNNNELLNAQEVNRELNRKIESINLEIENIKTTHSDILTQSSEYNTKINQAQVENDHLSETYKDLKTKFDKLSMKDNLDNTIKANKDFSERNEELQAQIEQLKKTIDLKLEKLNKYVK